MELNLTELETNQHHFLTPAAGVNFGHAASVCFESQGHALKVDMIGEGNYNKSYAVTRYDVTDQMKRTWGDEEFTTEQGAYGIAFLVASSEIKVKAIEDFDQTFTLQLKGRKEGVISFKVANSLLVSKRT